MKIEFDPDKRAKTLVERGLDFRDAQLVFAGRTLGQADDRLLYPEQRMQTYGYLDGRLVMVVWTAIPGGRRIISMRKCNDREQRSIRP